MTAFLLSLFPPHTHPLVLASDPDSLLANEGLLTELGTHGFAIIHEPDPVLLRHRLEQIKPFGTPHPVIIVTLGALESLPYDLWQAGHHLKLSLHEAYPNLSYPLLRQLTPNQRARLNNTPQPATPFGQNATIEYLFRHVFALDLSTILQPAALIQWLMHLHQDGLAPLPPPLRDDLFARLAKFSVYQDWDLPALLERPQALSEFLQTQWDLSLQNLVGQKISETSAPYLLRFENDPALQDSLPGLVRSGLLTPIALENSTRLPNWAFTEIAISTVNSRLRLAAAHLHILSEQLNTLSSEARWSDWQSIARRWAEFSVIWYGELAASDDLTPLSKTYQGVQNSLDTAFSAWFLRAYASLGAQKLPTPHHVHHIPTYLNYQRQGKIALLVLDGMSLTDWVQISNAWQTRHSDWLLNESLILAQVPTITALSRYALVSGLRPADFYDPARSAPTESRAWLNFWAREGLPEQAALYHALSPESESLPAEISGSRLQALCLIDRTIDEIMHGATLGAGNLSAALRLWLKRDQPGQNSSARLERQLSSLLALGFSIFLTSDHGHCEARGIGTPSEGLTAQTRGKRARLYQDSRAARLVQNQFSHTLVWENDGILPTNLTCLMPVGREAFSTAGETVVTHGGISIDEVIVPFVQITLAPGEER